MQLALLLSLHATVTAPSWSQEGYILIYSLAAHSHDADCAVFVKVFAGYVDEGVRQEQAVLQAELQRCLMLLDQSINHVATGWLHKADVKTALAGFFKNKNVSKAGIEGLLDAHHCLSRAS